MRVILIIGGALLGLTLAYGSIGLYGAVVGALFGLGIAELAATRARLHDLEREVQALRKQSARVEPKPAAARDAPPPVAVVRESISLSPREAPSNEPAPSPPLQAERKPAVSSPREVSPQAAARPPGDSAPLNEAHAWRSSPSPPEELAVFKYIREYFTGGNTLVRTGVIILFIGVAFLLRYVAEHTHVPIEFRLSGVAAGAIVLLVLGWRLRHKRPGYALALQGGAIGILYLIVFAAMRLFHLLPAGPAFAILVLLSAFSAALAVLQNSMAFALLGIGSGFLAPVLASTGEGNHVVLFSYYAILNLGILAIAWFKAWRPLNVVGFLFTFVIGTAWGVLKYSPALFSTTEPFLILFFLLYIAIAVLFSLRQRPILNGYVDGTIVFGVPVVVFGLQAAMVHNWPFYTAYSALVVSALYLLLAWLLHVGKRDTQRMLVEAFMALGVAFLTLAVPLALDGRWSAATWALEGAALVWVGCRQGRLLARASGSLLQLAGGIIFLADLPTAHADIPVLNSSCLGALMIAFASVYSSYLFQRIRSDLRDYELPFTSALYVWGALWWLFAGASEILRHVHDSYQGPSLLVFVTATALISSEIHRRLAIGAARGVPLLLLPAMVIYTLVTSGQGQAHPLMNGGWAAWPLAFGGFYFLCRRHESDAQLWPARPHHIAAALLLIGLLTWECAWQLDHAVKGGGSWPAIAWALVPTTVLLFLPKLTSRVSWPFAAHEETYVAIVGSVLAAFITLWSLWTNVTLPGDPYPLRYLPLLNPLDIAQMFVLMTLFHHGMHLQRSDYPVLNNMLTAQQRSWAFAVLVFVWLNAVLLRTLHYYADVPYDPESLYRSRLVQTALTIFWTVLALATMLYAARRSTRFVWFGGAALLTVVIAKLLLIDREGAGTIERIVSFVGVGVLMLVVGYFSPLPPSRKEAT